MKTSIKTLICALALGTSVAFANPDSGAAKPSTFATGMYQTKDGDLKVNIIKSAPVLTTVLIMNANGDILARETLAKKQTKGSIKFDLSALRDGEYSIAVVSKGEKEVKKFTIASE